MKITEFGTLIPSSGVKKRDATSPASSFADVLAAAESGETEQTNHLSDIVATAALNNMLALQEISEEDIKRKKLVLQGKSMLDSLERLRHQLLAGDLSHSTLLDLNRQLMLQKQSVNDPRLMEVIEDIELRAAVELAKLEMAHENRIQDLGTASNND